METSARKLEGGRPVAIALWCAAIVWAAFIFFMSAKSGALGVFAARYLTPFISRRISAS